MIKAKGKQKVTLSWQKSGLVINMSLSLSHQRLLACAFLFEKTKSKFYMVVTVLTLILSYIHSVPYRPKQLLRSQKRNGDATVSVINKKKSTCDLTYLFIIGSHQKGLVGPAAFDCNCLFTSVVQYFMDQASWVGYHRFEKETNFVAR